LIVSLCYGISFVIYISILLWGILGEHNGEYFGYSLFSFYYILPITSFFGALILGIIKTYWKWLYPALFGTFGFIITLIVFKRITHMSFGLYFIPSLIGLAIGLIVHKIR